MSFLDMINIGISLTVAAIPEGLPTVVTIVLTIGAKEMAKNSALVRKLSSVETLGSTTVICPDTTGTLTQNKMQVLSIFAGGKYYSVSGEGYEPQGSFYDESKNKIEPREDKSLFKLLEVSALCSDSQIVEEDGVHTIIGTPTEGAVVVAATKAGLDKGEMLKNGIQIIHTFAFDSTRKLMSVVVKTADEKYYVMVKGAPDVIAKRSKSIVINEKIEELNSTTHHHIDEAIEKFASGALRTLAIAYKPLEKDKLDLAQESYEDGFVFLGLHGIIDPPRQEVIPAIEECHSAGIRIVILMR